MEKNNHMKTAGQLATDCFYHSFIVYSYVRTLCVILFVCFLPGSQRDLSAWESQAEFALIHHSFDILEGNTLG